MSTPTTVQVKIQLRRDTSANWASVNPVLLAGEMGLETNTNRIKVGDGSTAWNSLGYFPFVISGGTVTGNLEIGTTGTLTFEGSSADNFETTLGVINPTADRTINLPNVSGTIITTGDTGTVTSTMIADGTIVDADVSASAEIAVSKLADGAARQLLQTDAAGTGVEWTSNVDIPGTLDVTGAATFDGAVTVAGDLTVNGTTTNINTQNLVVEDKNIILGDVATPTDVTADGGGITLKGATDKTITWVDATDAWTSSERFSVPLGSAASPSLTFTGDENTGIYSPGADQVAISTGGSGRLFVDASGNVGAGTSSPASRLHVDDGFITTGRYGNLGALILRRAGGTAAAPTQITSAASIAGVYARGLNELGAYNNVSSVGFGSDGAVTSTSSPGYFVVETTPSSSTSPQERLRITSAGLVGVGTSAPVSPLHVKRNDTEVGSTVLVEQNGLGDAGIEFLLTGTRAWAAGIDNSDEDKFKISAAAGVHTDTKLTVTTGGNVGIGTASPIEALHVEKNYDGATVIRVANSDAGSAAGSYLQLRSGSKFTNLQNYGAGNLFLIAGSGGVNTYYSDFDTHIWRNNGGTAERARIDSSGRLLVGTSSDSGGALLQVNGDRIRVATAKTPASATATGTAGEICWDASYVYVCTATNTWKRAALSTW